MKLQLPNRWLLIKNNQFFALKIIVSIGMICTLLVIVDFDLLLNTLINVNLNLVIVALFAQGLVFYLQSLRQFIFFRSELHTFWMFVKANMISVFISNFLPGNTMGEIYKVWYLKNCNISYQNSVAIILFDRIIASIIIGTGGIISFFILDTDNLQLLWSNLNSFFITIAIIILVVFIIILNTKSLLSSLKTTIVKFQLLKPNNITICLFLNIIVYLLRLFKFHLIINSAGLDVSLPILASVLFVVQLSILFPLSFGSLGVMEGGIISVLVYFGVDYTTSLATAIMNRCLLVFYSAIGGVFLLQDIPKLKGMMTIKLLKKQLR